MNKLSIFIILLASIFLMVGCGVSEDDDFEADSDGSTSNPDPDSDSSDADQCEKGTFMCETNNEDGVEYSYWCKYHSFEKFEACKAGCDTSTGFCKPWKDPDSGLTWSSVKNRGIGVTDSEGLTWEEMTRQEAVDYCKNLKDGDFNDWHLPTIYELRTLIQNCPATQKGGSCKIGSHGTSYSQWWDNSCKGCSKDNDGGYCKLDPTIHECFWSSSVQSDNTNWAWQISYDYAMILRVKIAGDVSTPPHGNVRCVR